MAGGRGRLNGGPLKLEHDVTPIDPAHDTEMNLSNSQNRKDACYRFQGFPDHSFSNSRKPILGLVEWEGPDKSYRKAQHFVKGIPAGTKRPVVAATGDLSPEQQTKSRPLEMHGDGIQYGSNGIPTSTVVATPKKTIFFLEDRTSAEKRKRTKQTKDAEWDFARAKQEKHDLQNKTVLEKKEDLEMLKNYKPWGRPGGGAPPADTKEFRRTKALEHDRLGDGETTSYFPAFGRPGNGAPLRTDSGNIITNIRASHDIRFLTTKGMPEHAATQMRYAQPKEEGQKYIDDLTNMAKEKQTITENEKAIEAEQEKLAMQYNPFGKPGAGAPLKTDSGNLKTGRARTLVKNHYEMREVEQKELVRSRRASLADDSETAGTQYDPWGKGQGAPERDPKGNVRRFKWADGNNVQEFVDPSIEGATLQTKTQGGGGHRADEKGERVTRFKTTLVHDPNSGGIRTALRHTEPAIFDSPRDAVTKDPSDPWGKPEAGAPIINESGTLVTVKTGKAYYDKLGMSGLKPEEQHVRKLYLSTLKKEMDDHKAQRQQEVTEYKMPGGEVASWIRKKEIGYPKRDPNSGELLPVHHKHTSDVTQQRMNIRRPSQFAAEDPKEYHTDLARQAEERYRKNQLDKTQSRELAQQHHQTFDTLWNRPGNGAPNPDAIKRHDLDMEKHAQTDRYDQPPWKRPLAPSADPTRAQWQRTKALDLRFTDNQVATKQAYRPRAPWAVIN